MVVDHGSHIYKLAHIHKISHRNCHIMQCHEFVPPAKFIPRSRRCKSAAATSAAEDSSKTPAALENSAKHFPPSSCLDRSRYNRMVGEIIHEELDSHRDRLLISELEFISSWNFEEPLLFSTFEE